MRVVVVGVVALQVDVGVGVDKTRKNSGAGEIDDPTLRPNRAGETGALGQHLLDAVATDDDQLVAAHFAGSRIQQPSRANNGDRLRRLRFFLRDGSRDHEAQQQPAKCRRDRTAADGVELNVGVPGDIWAYRHCVSLLT